MQRVPQVNTNNKPLTAYGSNKDEEEIHKKYARLATGIIIEIGVLEGYTTRILLENSSVRVCGIDPIIPDSMNPALIGNIAAIQQLEQDYERFVFFADYSHNVISQFSDEEAGYIFVDGNHTYDAVKQDFNDYLPKVKIGGFIGLHDSCMNLTGGAKFWPSPSQLCMELIAETEQRVDYIESCHALSIFQRIK